MWYYAGEEEAGNICLDYRLDILATLIHELLHYFNPDWKENRVKRRERELVNQLSLNQMKLLLRELAIST